jgi:hypothetical protein
MNNFAALMSCTTDILIPFLESSSTKSLHSQASEESFLAVPVKNRVFKKELYNGIPNTTVRQVL